jgi:hypothetical protein
VIWLFFCGVIFMGGTEFVAGWTEPYVLEMLTKLHPEFFSFLQPNFIPFIMFGPSYRPNFRTGLWPGFRLNVCTCMWPGLSWIFILVCGQFSSWIFYSFAVKIYPPPSFFSFLFDSLSYILAYYLHFPDFLINHNFLYGVMHIYEGGPHVFLKCVV